MCAIRYAVMNNCQRDAQHGSGGWHPVGAAPRHRLGNTMRYQHRCAGCKHDTIERGENAPQMYLHE